MTFLVDSVGIDHGTHRSRHDKKKKEKKEKQEKDISAYHNDRKRLQKVWLYLDVNGVNMKIHGVNIKLRPR